MEKNDVLIAVRVDKRLQAKIAAEQKRLERLSGLKTTQNKVVRALIERGLETTKEK